MGHLFSPGAALQPKYLAANMFALLVTVHFFGNITKLVEFYVKLLLFCLTPVQVSQIWIFFPPRNKRVSLWSNPVQENDGPVWLLSENLATPSNIHQSCKYSKYANMWKIS